MVKLGRSYKQNSIYYAILIGIILILINFISVRIFTRIDLTENKIYTLSKASKKLIQNLEDQVTVKAYFTEDLPSPYNNNRRLLIDVLNDYRSYSNGNVNFEFISPANEEMEREAQSNGIPPIEVQVIQEDKVEVKRAYMGLVIIYEGKKESIPIISDLAGLEYDLSLAIKRLTQTEKKTIAYATTPEFNPITSMRITADFLSKQYSLIPIDITNATEISNKHSAFLIINPEFEFNDTFKTAIDNYLMNGGKLGIFSSSFKIDQTFQTHIGTPINSNLDDLLSHYGIKINKDLVRDAQCAPIIVTRRQGQFTIQNQVRFPYLIRATNLNRSNVITKQMNNLILQFSSSIDTSLAMQKNIKAEVLVYTSEATARQFDGVLLDPFYQYSENDFPEEFVPLAVLFNGQFDSYYYGKNSEVKISKSPTTDIVVVGTGLFMQDIIVQNARDNMIFFANIIDYLADDSGLISIRTKTVSLPPLDKVSDDTRKLLKYGNMIIPPVLIILFGFYRWKKRQSIKRMFENQAMG